MIKKILLAHDKLKIFPKLTEDYRNQSENLRDFISDFPSENSILAFAQKREALLDRPLLVDAIQATFGDISCTAVQKDNLQALLSPDTLTITCGHQLNVFGGPLYVVYKIQTVINLCKQLNEKQQEKRFVPVFWLASEDHDLEEVSQFHFFGKEDQWQTHQTGACGRMTTEGLSALIEDWQNQADAFGLDAKMMDKLKMAYAKPSLDRATVAFLNSLFAHQGLLFLNADNAILKRVFLHKVKADIQNRLTKNAVDNTSQRLRDLGYHNQTNAREINYFFLGAHKRMRIDVLPNGELQIGEERTTTIENLLEEWENQPGTLSPNVITRPIYQEFVLPNVVFVGGAGELSYWLQLSEAFEKMGVPYPILLQRNSFLLVNEKTHNLAEKIGLKAEHWFQSRDAQIRILMGDENALDLSTEIASIESAFGSLSRKAGSVDFTLVRAAESELAQVLSRIEHLKTKVLRALKQKNETRIAQLDRVRAQLFPNEGIQERKWGAIEAASKFSPDFLEIIQAHTEPLNPDFAVLIAGGDEAIPYNSGE